MISKKNDFLRIMSFINILILTLPLLVFASDFKTNQEKIPAAEIGAPFIQTYTDKEYGKDAGLVNLCALQDKQGIMYFGNEQGLLVFDGYWWQLIRLPNKSWVRSLKMDSQGRIFVGGMNEFGQLMIDRTGDYNYWSLLPKVDKKYHHCGDIWNIFIGPDGIYFQSIDHLYWYHHDRIDVIPFSFGTWKQVNTIEPMIVAGKNKELFWLHQGKLYSLPHTKNMLGDFYPGRLFLTPFKNGKILILAGNKGFYTYDLLTLLQKTVNPQAMDESKIEKTIIEKFPTQIDSFIDATDIYSLIQISEESYALGTLSSGIFIINHHGQLIQRINKNRGLAHDRIWSMYPDHHHNLWILLHKGIAYAEISSPVSFFSELNGLAESITTIKRFENRIYTGGSAGISFLPAYKIQQLDDANAFTLAASFKPECWDTLIYHGHLLFATNSGIHLLKNGKVTLAYKSDRTVNVFGKTPLFPEHLFLGQYKKFMAIQVSGDGSTGMRFHSEIVLKEIEENIYQILADKNGHLWLTTLHSGIIHIYFPKQSIVGYKIFKYGLENGLPSLSHNHLLFMDQQIYLGTAQGIYQVVGEKNGRPGAYRFQPAGICGLTDVMAVPVISQDPYTKKLWLQTDTGLMTCFSKNGTSFQCSDKPFKRIPQTITGMYFEADGVVWLTANDGLYRYDSTIDKDYRIPFKTLIRRVTCKGNQLLFNGNYMDPNSYDPQSLRYSFAAELQTDLSRAEISFQQNTLVFHFSAAFYESNASNMFQYRLSGFEEAWSDWSSETKKEYTNLPEGSYSFIVRGRNLFSEVRESVPYSIVILPPYYRTWYAYLTYLMLSISLIYGLIRFNSHRLIAAKRRLEKIINDRTLEIARQRDEIKASQDALWGEMQLAKKIQTVLLPDQLIIPGYEITACMQPADEVGGDYYDVICIDNKDRRGGSCARPQASGQLQEADLQHSNMGNQKGLPLQNLPPTPESGQPQGFAPTVPSNLYPSYWLSIGDVSGHGVSAGLVMMMVQTAIRTVLNNAPLESADQVLLSVNRIIYDNIKKMGEDKYMTITLLNIQENGNIHYSGLHQDIMVYRSSTNQVELLETKGIWIGMIPAIDNMLKIDKFVMAPGDTMLLYTDGLVEAVDHRQQMFSQEKLALMFKELGCQSCQEIKNELLKSLESYTCQDDVTFMVVKKK